MTRWDGGRFAARILGYIQGKATDGKDCVVPKVACYRMSERDYRQMCPFCGGMHSFEATGLQKPQCGGGEQVWADWRNARGWDAEMADNAAVVHGVWVVETNCWEAGLPTRWKRKDDSCSLKHGWQRLEEMADEIRHGRR